MVAEDIPVSEKQLKLRAKWSRSYWRNREKKLAQRAIWRANNLEKMRKSRRDWQRTNWPYRQEYMRKYYAANRAKIMVRSRHQYRDNKERHNFRVGIWKSKNREKVTVYQKRYHSKSAGIRLEWRNKNRGKLRARSSERRAMERNVTINKAQIAEWMERMRSMEFARCYYCDSMVPGGKIHFDHIVALKKGGEHSIRNLCVSCRTCNLSKGIKDLQRWKRYGQMVLTI